MFSSIPGLYPRAASSICTHGQMSAPQGEGGKSAPRLSPTGVRSEAERDTMKSAWNQSERVLLSMMLL